MEFRPATPSRPPQRPAPLMDSCCPSAHERSGGPSMARAFQAHASSALRVWSPSQRFPHSEPASALFHADSAPGLLPSEHSPPAGSARVSTRGSLRAVLPPGLRTGEPMRPAREAAASRLVPGRSPVASDARLTHPLAGGSPGISLSKALRQRRCAGCNPRSSHALERNGLRRHARASEYPSTAARPRATREARRPRRPS